MLDNNASELAYLLGLSLNDILSVKKVRDAYEQLGSMEALWKATADTLTNLGFTDKENNDFNKYKPKHNHAYLMRQVQSAIDDKVTIIKITDRFYPRQLKETIDSNVKPPLMLFYKGSLSLLNENFIAIVGTRESSARAHSMARKMAREIASKGYVVASGLARGIDTEAHVGALEAYNGKTASVLAWMNPVYPSENIQLFKDILRNGAVISENYLRPKEGYAPSKFVLRNRIISGLSEAVIAVETDEEGGTIHQVALAVSQGRPVFAFVPDESDQRAWRGYARMITMGAMPLRELDDLFYFLEHRKEKVVHKSLDSFG